MTNPDELNRRIGVVEEDVRSLYRAMNELASDMKVMAEATKAMQITLKESTQNSSRTVELLHEHALQIQENRMAVDTVTSKVDQMGDVGGKLHELDKRIAKNEGVTTTAASIAKRLTIGLLLSAVGLATAALTTPGA